MVRTMVRYTLYAMGCVLLACGCDDGTGDSDTSPGSSDCEERAGAWSVLLSGKLAEHRSCNDDEDCVLHEHRLECANGAVVTNCPMVVAESGLPTALEALDEQGAAFCSETPERCSASGSCPAVIPVCDDGTCVSLRSVAPAGLDPNAVVFAAVSGGGFLISTEEQFFVGERHGRWGLWVYGDRRAVEISSDGYRVYLEGTVSEQAFGKLLALAQATELSGQHSYSACNATDGWTKVVAADLPGTAFKASSYMGFDNDICPGYVPGDYDQPQAPNGMVALAKAVFAITLEGATELVPDDIVLAGHVVEEETRAPSYGCSQEDTVPWPFDDVGLPEGSSLLLWTFPLSGTVATEVRSFIREHQVERSSAKYQSACVKQGNTLYSVYYDDVPEGEDAWPF
jgi:hypothetical protein